jgi:hypothetical protein
MSRCEITMTSASSTTSNRGNEALSSSRNLRKEKLQGTFLQKAAKN